MKRLLHISHRSLRYRALLPFLTVIVIFSMFAAPAYSADVSLQWNSVAEADGYNVYYGTESGSYQTPEDVLDQTSHTLSLDPGTYYFAVTAYNNYGESGYSEEVSATVADSNPPTSVSLASDLASPQPEGTTVTFTAQASGGTGSYEYRFWLRDTQGQWSIVQDYSASANFIWNVTAGIDRISVWAKNTGSGDNDSVWSYMLFSTDMNLPTSVSLTSDLASPQPEGTTVTFTAEANGGTGSYEYRFWLRDAQGEWSIVQDYSTSANFIWNVVAGIDRISVWAKNAGSNDDDRVWNEMPFSTDMNPPTSVSLTSDLASPQPEGMTVTFTAEANGGSGSYQYKFYFRNPNGQWAMVQDYSSSSNYIWNTAGFTGTSYIQVWAKNTGATDAYQVWDTSCCIVSSDTNPPTSVSLSSNLPNPQPEGTVVTFTAQVTGGNGNYEYKYYLCNPNGQWAMVQDYSASPNYVWNTTGFAGTSYLQVWVRNAGSPDTYQVWNTAQFSTDMNQPTSAYLSANITSPQPEGALVTFTAQVTGGNGSYEYKYYLCNPNGQWTMVQDYSTSPNYIWNTTGFVGICYLQVWVRNAGSADQYQVFDSIAYEIE